MSNIKLDVYLFFKDGKCKEAMEFYKSIFGGELTLSTFKDVPGEPIPGSQPDWVMHASLSGGLVNLMASDSTDQAPFGRSAITISLGGEDESALTDAFNKLAEGGTVESPLKKEFWGDIFGSLTDKFGIDWMVNIGHDARDDEDEANDGSSES